MPSSSHAWAAVALGTRGSKASIRSGERRPAGRHVRAGSSARPASDRPKCLTFPSLNQILDGAGDILDRHVRIDAVLIEQVDTVGLQPLEGRLGDFADVLRAAVHSGLLARRGIDGESRGSGDDHLICRGRMPALRRPALRW